MIEVVSLSLGSPDRNRTAEIRFGDERVRIRRIGVDGSYDLARSRLERLDGRVQAIGLGGINFAYRSRGRAWPMPGAQSLRKAVRDTPVVDGSGFKDWIEPLAATSLPQGETALVVSMLDRPLVAAALRARGYRTFVGDSTFALGVPLWPTPEAFHAMACATMPILRLLPLRAVYGRRTARAELRKSRWNVIWGDVKLLRRHPVAMAGATMVVGSAREEDVKWLARCGVSRVLSAAPPIGGETFGANVWEAVITAVYGKLPSQSQMLETWRSAMGAASAFRLFDALHATG